jgi:hypothetical protein
MKNKMLDGEEPVANPLGDGKEADCKTNRPDNQTDPALFAAPHFLWADLRSRATTFGHDRPGLQAC